MERERRVLVVEDDATIAESITARLRAEGFAVEVAHDGPAAVAADAEHEPDLVVLAGFMKLVGPAFLDRFAGRCLNTHPALSPLSVREAVKHL